jgi:hypothetical protein
MHTHAPGKRTRTAPIPPACWLPPPVSWPTCPHSPARSHGQLAWPAGPRTYPSKLIRAYFGGIAGHGRSRKERMHPLPPAPPASTPRMLHCPCPAPPSACLHAPGRWCWPPPPLPPPPRRLHGLRWLRQTPAGSCWCSCRGAGRWAHAPPREHRPRSAGRHSACLAGAPGRKGRAGGGRGKQGSGQLTLSRRGQSPADPPARPSTPAPTPAIRLPPSSSRPPAALPCPATHLL